jgi:hypothetical protein
MQVSISRFHISQLVRHATSFVQYIDFVERALLIAQQLPTQGYFFSYVEIIATKIIRSSSQPN